MSSDVITPEHSVDAFSSPVATNKPARVMSCVLCAQRKVKCDRKFPCSNCTRTGLQCVPASTVSRQRRRRFPERELLERLHQYEDLLKTHNIAFQPLHTNLTNHAPSPENRGGSHSNHGQARKRALGGPTGRSRQVSGTPTDSQATLQASRLSEYEGNNLPKNFWHAMNRTTVYADDDNGDQNHDNDADSDDTGSPSPILRKREVVKAWDELYDDHLNRSEHLLFCSRSAGIELSTLHPPQAQIFKLWQIYLENVDPLLKLTHTPTFQPRIIDAASDLTSVPPNMEALMFAIYCMAVFSLTQYQCQMMFGTPRGDVIRGYQLGAREALLNCGFLKTSDRECLTALHLYLISLKSETDPRSLASMLATAVRIAQRMGIDSEAVNSKYPALEAELRRRLWWSLVLFDSRIAEMTDSRLATLLPTWDCKVPLSVNDSALRNDMKNRPIEFEITSEAVFAVTRCRIGNYIRHSASHLDFVNPTMKYLAEKSRLAHGLEYGDLVEFEAMIETNYIARCDAQNPLHFMTIWWARVSLAKVQFAHYLSTRATDPDKETTEQRDDGLRRACDMLECDTALMESPSITGYRWLIYLHFPFPAYIHLAQDLKQRPLSGHASRAWEVMSANCEVRLMGLEQKDNPMETKPNNPFFSIFAGLILQAWASREATLVQLDMPIIVAQIKQRMDHMNERAAALRDQLPVPEDANSNGPVLADQGSFYPLYSQHDPMNMGMEPFPMPPTQDSIGFESTQWNWSAPNWSAMPYRGW